MAQTVRDIMTTNPREISLDQPIMAAAQMMRDAGIGDVIVTEGGQLRGILTDRDIVVRAVAEGIDLTAETVDSIFSGDVVTVSPDTPISEAVETMRDRAIRRLPVCEDDRPVGIVSLGDLAMGGSGESALEEISAAPPNT